MARNFKDLSEREILALAISLEEEDGRVYADFADGLRETYPATAKLFDDMGAEESGHRASLIATYRERFGEHIPLIRRQDVKGFVQRRPFWLTRPLKISEVRKQAEIMELETRQFYQKAIGQVTDAGIRNCSAIWRRSSASIRWRRRPCRRALLRQLEGRKMKRSGDCLCCRLCSPGWQG